MDLSLYIFFGGLAVEKFVGDLRVSFSIDFASFGLPRSSFIVDLPCFAESNFSDVLAGLLANHPPK